MLESGQMDRSIIVLGLSGTANQEQIGKIGGCLMVLRQEQIKVYQLDRINIRQHIKAIQMGGEFYEKWGMANLV